ncbi:unnamed protein product [Clavelina lepadiformis]|uniref:Uncharacterized protein n=1 Tax=Clavelina lepadiformis TaxID=159417 RepID=A0ABP0H2Z9_CLALP
MDVDPDYAFDISQESVAEAKRTRQLQDDAREATAEKIRNILRKHFAEAILAKENEVDLITERLTEARQLLDRLRACVVASYYASSFVKPLEKKKEPEPGAAQHPAIQVRILAFAALSLRDKFLLIWFIKVIHTSQ